jgi:sugar (pentulose or hexulose) kinase
MTVAVLDIGKTNVKLSAASEAGDILESLSTPNAVHPGPPYRHHDLASLETWALDALAELGRRHPITAIVACGHGSGGVLVDETGPAMPMIDYEDEPPADIDALYHAIADGYRDRGSPIMLGASHTARQLLWLQTAWPDAFARARWFLGLPQYWAWRFSGVAASELTTLGAQSHLWSVPDRRFAPIVAARGWQHLMPPLAPAWQSLGPLRPELARRTGLPAQTRVLCGIHDSSANFYRYQAAGMRDFTLVSTGTWLVALSDQTGADALDETRGMTCNADPAGAPLAGALCMGGREFSLVAGAQPAGAVADAAVVARLIAEGSMAVPCFGDEDGLLPGRARHGYIAGPPPDTPAERRGLALLQAVLLTDLLLTALGSAGTVVLDGTFAADPLYPSLVAAVRPAQPVLFNLDPYGAAAGTALLAGHASRRTPAPLALQSPPLPELPGLSAYRALWRDRATALPAFTETPS